MLRLPLYLTFMMLLFNFSSLVEAKSVCFDMSVCDKNLYKDVKSYAKKNKGKNIDKYKYRLLALPGLIENYFINEFELDIDLRVPGLIGDRLYATGDIYIDSDYFFNNVDDGLVFEQKGSVYFEPALPKDWSLPEFSDWDFSGGIGFSDDDFPIDYLVTADLANAVRSFHSLGNIYIVDTGYASAVPLPGAAWLFATAMIGLVSLRQKSRSL